MKTKILTLLVWIMVMSLLQSCNKEEINPRKAILGKWEITGFGGSSSPKPFPANGEYLEYELDSVLSTYRNDILTSQRKYWFEDSIIIISKSFIDDFGKTIVFKTPYKYEFVTPDKLRLELKYPAVITTFHYKRIN